MIEQHYNYGGAPASPVAHALSKEAAWSKRNMLSLLIWVLVSCMAIAMTSLVLVPYYSPEKPIHQYLPGFLESAEKHPNDYYFYVRSYLTFNSDDPAPAEVIPSYRSAVALFRNVALYGSCLPIPAMFALLIEMAGNWDYLLRKGKAARKVGITVFSVFTFIWYFSVFSLMVWETSR